MRHLARKIWGVDSVYRADSLLYEYVKEKYGAPKYWGRVITASQKASVALSEREAAFLHSKDIRILPIFDEVSGAIGFEKGTIAASNAVFHARKAGVPKEKALFANIGSLTDIDSEWLYGWTERVLASGYRPGCYYTFQNVQFFNSYCKMAAHDKGAARDLLLWCSGPYEYMSSERKAPLFKPAVPHCRSNTWIWQYGGENEHTPIAANLADDRILKYLY